MAEVKDRTRNWSAGRIKRQPTRRKQESLTPGERRRLTQLVICVLLFSIVFLGRGLPQGHLSSLGSTVGELIHKNTDFRAAFSKVGQSVSEGEPFVETFGVFWSEVLGTGKDPQGGDAQGASPDNGSPPENPEVVPPSANANQQPENQSQGEQKPQVVETLPTDTNKQAKTENKDTKLLEEETTTPVMGVLTSGFGYRIHPIDGEWKEHEGIDIMANEGTPILAFAAGEVDYVGESPSYGLYLQLKHSNGITSFYAHCSELCVKKGQKVADGQVIAKVGATGNTTGAHLHFELKKDGKRIDPALYVESKAQ
ncbi:MAG: peptidase [Evtepia sp.]|jgi:hypothetical protein|nr:peptidase [Evtepia sp.]